MSKKLEAAFLLDVLAVLQACSHATIALVRRYGAWCEDFGGIYDDLSRENIDWLWHVAEGSGAVPDCHTKNCYAGRSAACRRCKALDAYQHGPAALVAHVPYEKLRTALNEKLRRRGLVIR